jgi:hypothetical protein
MGLHGPPVPTKHESGQVACLAKPENNLPRIDGGNGTITQKAHFFSEVCIHFQTAVILFHNSVNETQNVLASHSICPI